MLDSRVVEELISRAEVLEKLHIDYIQSLETYMGVSSQSGDTFPEGCQLAGELYRKAIQEHESVLLLQHLTHDLAESILPAPLFCEALEIN